MVCNWPTVQVHRHFGRTLGSQRAIQLRVQIVIYAEDYLCTYVADDS